MNYYQCFSCKMAFPLTREGDPKCPSCGKNHGEVLSPERFAQGMESGVIFNIDPRTGKRAKKRK